MDFWLCVYEGACVCKCFKFRETICLTLFSSISYKYNYVLTHFFLLLWLEWILLWAWTRWRRNFLRPEWRRTPCWTRRSSAARSRHPEQAPQKKFQFLLIRKYLLRFAIRNKSANYYTVVLKIITRQSKWRSSFLSYSVLPNNYN